MIVTPLITGTHHTQKVPEGMLLPGHTGSVTLIRHEGTNILVDTGGRGMFPALKMRLKEVNLKADQIDIVILTHLHLDHSYNIARFVNARVFAWMHEWRDRETLRIEGMDGYKLLNAITILQTPGHAEEHVSVVVQDDQGTNIVIGGDAVNEEYAVSGLVKSFAYDQNLYKKNADRLLAIADMIIPGHGRPFYPR